MQSVEVVGKTKNIIARTQTAAEHAKFFLDIFQKEGILVLAGADSKTYNDQLVLGTLFSLLSEVNESYEVIDHTLFDFHLEGRRKREVKVVARKNFFSSPWVPVAVSDDLLDLQAHCLPHAADLQALLLGENHLPMTIAEGKENKKLHDILTASGNSVTEVFVINFSKTGNRRKNPPKAYVYGTPKALN